MPTLLENIQRSLYDAADKAFKEHTIKVTNWSDFVPALNAKNVVLVPHCLTEECEDDIKNLSGRREEAEGEAEVPFDEKAPSMARRVCVSV